MTGAGIWTESHTGARHTARSFLQVDAGVQSLTEGVAAITVWLNLR